MPYELKSALSKVSSTAMKFGVYKGTKGVQILISQGTPTQPLLTEMMTQTGSNKPIIQGKCFKEESKYIFASKAGEHAIDINNAMRTHATGHPYELRDLHGDDEESTDSTHTDSEHEGQTGWQNVNPKQGQVPRQVFQTTNRQNVNTNVNTNTQPPNINRPRTDQRGGNLNRPLPTTPPPQGGTQTHGQTNTPGGNLNRPLPTPPNPQGGTQTHVPPPPNRVPPQTPGVNQTHGQTTPQSGPQTHVSPPPNRVPPPTPGGNQGHGQTGPQTHVPPPPPNRVPPSPQGGTQTHGQTNPQDGPRDVPPNTNQQGGPQGTHHGKETLHARTDAILKDADIKARTLSENAYSPQGVQTTLTALSTGPLPVDRKVLAKLSSKKLSKEYVESATSEQAKAKRKDEIKEERLKAATLVKAMKKASPKNKKMTPEHVDALETACLEAVECFSKRVRGQVRKFQDQIFVSQGTNNEVAINKARERLENAVNSPEANRLLTTADALLEARLRKNENLIADLKAAIQAAAGENPKTEATVTNVRNLAQQYRKLFAEHASHYEKLPGRERPQAIVDQEKAADKILDEAEATLFGLKQAKLGPPPWDSTKEEEGKELIDKGREMLAKDLLKNGTVHRPSGGTSEVMVLKDAQQKVQFAFKTAKGESSMMDLPPGGGAIREAVTSKITDAILEQTGFDFGFPKVTIGRLGGNTGALVEGLRGKLLPPAEDMGKTPEERAINAAFQNSIPGKQLQKTIFAGLVSGNFLDLKWDNVFWEGEGDQINARPFDAGASFLPTDTIKGRLYGVNGTPSIGGNLLLDAEDKPTKGGLEPMDPELVEAMLKIDTDALGKVIDDEVQRHAGTELEHCLDNESKNNGLKCLTILQGVLRAHQQDPQPPSLAEVLREVQAELLKTFPEN